MLYLLSLHRRCFFPCPNRLLPSSVRRSSSCHPPPGGFPSLYPAFFLMQMLMLMLYLLSLHRRCFFPCPNRLLPSSVRRSSSCHPPPGCFPSLYPAFFLMQMQMLMLYLLSLHRRCFFPCPNRLLPSSVRRSSSCHPPPGGFP